MWLVWTFRLEKNMPDNWKNVKLGDVATFLKGKGLSKDEIVPGGSRECIHYGELFTKYGENIRSIISRTDLGGSLVLSEANDVLMPTSDVTPRGLSTASYIDKSGVVLGGDVLVVRPDSSELFGLFFAYYVRAMQHEVIRLVSGSTVFHLYGSDLKKLQLHLPPLLEQKRIVAILDVWEQYLNTLDSEIEIKRNIKKGLMQKLITSKVRLSGYFDSWEDVIIQDICNVKRGGSPRPIEQYITNNPDGLNWLRIGDIKSGSRYIVSTSQKIKPEGLKKTTMVHPGDFILSNSMSFGRPYIMKISACIHDGWLALMNINDRVNKAFLFYMLSSEYMQSKFSALSAGSGVQNLKKETVEGMTIKLPSKSEQDDIAELLTDMDEQLEMLVKKRSAIFAQKKYLIHNLVTGKIRIDDIEDKTSKELQYA